MPCNNKGKDEGEASIKQGMARTVQKPPEARGTLSLIALRRNQLRQRLDLELLVSRTMRQCTSIVGITSVWSFVIAVLANLCNTKTRLEDGTELQILIKKPEGKGWLLAQ